MADRECGNCHCEIGEGVHPYTVKIELYPRVDESLEITEADLKVDFDAELKKIIEKMEAMSEEERKLEEERIYTRFNFTLCPRCRDALARQLRSNMT